jgi:hypothetical protein
MSAVSLTIKALLAQSGVTSLVSTRIYPLPLPPSTTLPAIAVALSAEDEEMLLGGASQYAFASVQVHCIAASAGAAIDLGEAVKTALRDHYYANGDSPPSGASFIKEAVDFTDYSDNLTTHRRVMAFAVRWR